MVDTAFCTSAELVVYTQGTVAQATADLAVTLATGIIQGYTSQHLLYVADDVWTVPDDPRTLERRLAWLPGLDTTYGRSDLVIPLPAQPVVSVASVNGLIQNVGFRVAAGVLLVSSTALWTWPLTVTYTHGYATIPGDLKAVALRVAANVASNPGELKAETIGNYSYTVADPAVLTAVDKLVLNRYRTRSAALNVLTA